MTLESEQFNATFRVRSSSAKVATDVLTPRTMQALLDRPRSGRAAALPTRGGAPRSLTRRRTQRTLSAVSPLLPVVSLVLVVLLGAGWYGYQQNKKRLAALAALAAQHGWQWVAEDDSWAHRFDGHPFGEGDRRRARNVLTGDHRGRPMAAFDYSYVTTSTDSEGHRSTTTHHHAVCLLALPVRVPDLALSPDGLLGRIGSALGMQDIELESEEFNRRFRVTSQVPKFASDVLSPRTMEALLARPRQHLRLTGTTALCSETGSHSPDQLLQRLDTLSVVLDGVPGFVWKDLGAPTPAVPSTTPSPATPTPTPATGGAA